MKKYLLLLLMVVLAEVGYAQTGSKLTANTNSFSIDYSRYSINSLVLVFLDNTNVQFRRLDGTVEIVAHPYSFFQRSNGTPFASAVALRAFYDSFMVAKPSSSSGGGGTGAPINGPFMRATTKATNVVDSGVLLFNNSAYDGTSYFESPGITYYSMGDDGTSSGIPLPNYFRSSSLSIPDRGDARWHIDYSTDNITYSTVFYVDEHGNVATTGQIGCVGLNTTGAIYLNGTSTSSSIADIPLVVTTGAGEIKKASSNYIVANTGKILNAVNAFPNGGNVLDYPITSNGLYKIDWILKAINTGVTNVQISFNDEDAAPQTLQLIRVQRAALFTIINYSASYGYTYPLEFYATTGAHIIVTITATAAQYNYQFILTKVSN